MLNLLLYYLGNSSYSPTVLIADAAKSITNGFERVFGKNYIRVFCWAHVLRNLDQYLKTLSKEEKVAIKNDLYHLQLVANENEFIVISKCFLTKWAKCPHLSSFLSYFESEYLNQRFGWFEGYAPGFPSTNNSLEATNKTIKDENTLRERLPLKQFVEAAREIVHNWSREKEVTKVCFYLSKLFQLINN